MLNLDTQMVLVHGLRTPLARSGTSLASTGAAELGRRVVRELIDHLDLPYDIVDDVIFGCAHPPAGDQNVARTIALRAGLDHRTGATTVTQGDLSGLAAIRIAYERMLTGQGDVFIAGGTDVMSRCANRATALGDSMQSPSTGAASELLAREYGITRREQDEYSLRSHERAALARQNGRLAREIAPVYVPPNFEQIADADNAIVADQNLEHLTQLQPAWQEHQGTVTTATAAPPADGAVALLLMRESTARNVGLPTLARIKAHAWSGGDPARIGLGAAPAIAFVLQQAAAGIRDIGVVEINETFAAHLLAVLRALESPKFAREHLNRTTPVGAPFPDRLNVNGGAISLGHPVAATGARLALTAALEMQTRRSSLGLIATGSADGQGGAILLEAA